MTTDGAMIYFRDTIEYLHGLKHLSLQSHSKTIMLKQKLDIVALSF